MRVTYSTIFLLLIFHVFRSTPAFGQAKVLLVTDTQRMIALSHPKDREWTINDKFCVVQDKVEIACGRVVKSKKKAAFGIVDNRDDTIKKSDRVIRIDKDAFSEEDAFFIRSEIDPHEWFNLRDFTIGWNWLSGTGHFQQAISNNISLGLQMSLLLQQGTGNGTTRGTSLFLTCNFYEQYIYQGIWAQVGFGGAILNARVGGAEQQKGSLAVLASIGYRWRFVNGINIGATAGAQYFTSTEFTSFSLDFSGFLPNLLVDVGIVF